MLRRALVCAGAIVAMTLASSSPAFAHAARDQQGFHFEIGWGSEPTYAGIFNSVQMIVSQGGKPVPDVGDTMKVEVKSGTQTIDLPFESTFDPDSGEGTPGDYRAWIIPTSPGDYTFTLFGTIHGKRIRLSVTSGETTFDSVKDPAGVQFPVKEPAAADVQTLVTRQGARLDDSVAAAKKSASNAKTMGLVGIVVGGLGLVVGAVAVTRKRA
jgi:hypothetical protein